MKSTKKKYCVGNKLAGFVGVKKDSLNYADGSQLIMTSCIPVLNV